MKNKTNEQRLKKLISANHPLHNALLIERVLKIVEITRNDMKENPKDYEKGIVPISLIQDLFSNIDKHLS